MTSAELLEACEAFARRWHEAERPGWERQGYHTHDFMQHDNYNRKTVKDRGPKWIAVDKGTSGAYLVRKADGMVFQIKGYGVPNLRRPCGHVSELYR